MFLSNIEINISNSIFFFVNNSISFGLLYRLFITRRFYPTYAPGGGQLRLLLQAYILTTCEPRKTEVGDIIQKKRKCDLWQRPTHK
jgi:hypothetical protein